jgi:hypothetical protein
MIATWNRYVMRRSPKRRWVLAAICSGVLLASSPLGGQSPAAPRVPATIVLVHQMPRADVDYMIVRHPGEGGDFVLLPDSANGAILSLAILALLHERRVRGDRSEKLTFIRGESSRPSPAGRSVLPWAERVLSDARGAPLQEIAGVGEGKPIRIWLPGHSAH